MNIPASHVADLGPRSPDHELALILHLTRRLPHFRGAARVANALRRFYLRKPRGLVDVDVFAFRMRLDPTESVDAQLLFYPHLRDHVEIRLLRERLAPGDVFLDIGAHVGHYALVASALVGRNGKVLAIEADPVSYQKLSVNLQLNGAKNVTALNLGVANVAGKMRLRVNATGNRGGNTFLGTDELRLIPEFRHTCLDDAASTFVHDVEVRPLAEILAENDLRSVRGAKLDIEGFEFRVLKRFFADVDHSHFPSFLILEYEPTAVAGAGGDVIQLVASYGYRVYRQHLGSDKRNYIMILE